MYRSECCDAPVDGSLLDHDVGVCSECKEWSEFYDEEEEDE